LINVVTLSSLVLNVSSINGALPGTGSGNGSSIAVSTAQLYASSVSFLNVAPFPSYTLAVGGTGIYRSMDGINWALNTNTGTNIADIDYNGQLWVYAGGGGTTTSMRYSYDGITWNDSVGGGFTQNGNTVKWGGGLWVAGGINSPADANTLKYSGDGSNWSNATNGFTNTCLGLGWNGYMFVATGIITNKTNGIGSIKYSY
jgi:hypothetical protein